MWAGNYSEDYIRKMLNLDENSHSKNNIKKVQFSPLQQVNVTDEMEDITFLKEIMVDIEVELGSTELTLGEILDLETESVITLNKLAGDTVDVYLNKHWLASGEVLVINEEYGIRISSLYRDKELPKKQG